MKLLIVQGIFLLLTFILTLTFLLLGPLWIFQTHTSRRAQKKSQRIMSLCNCFSGGVFLAVSFMGLMPFVREKFDEVFGMMGVKITYPVADLFTVLGFFLVMVIEQSVHRCKHGKSSVDQRRESVKLAGDEYAIYTNSSDDESDLSDVNSKPATQLIPPSDNDSNVEKSPTKGDEVEIGQNRSPSRSHHGRASHHHSGHSPMSHGHSHTDAFHQASGLRAAILLLALSTHSLFEGMAMGLQDDFGKLISLYIAVIVHECLVSLAVGINLAKARLRLSTIVKLGVFMCLMIPIGMVIGIALGQAHTVWGGLLNGIIQGIAAGTFIYVIFLEVIPEEINSDTDKFLKSFFMFLGFIVIAALRTVAS